MYLVPMSEFPHFCDSALGSNQRLSTAFATANRLGFV